MIRKALAMFFCVAALQAQGPHCTQQPRSALEYRDPITGDKKFASMWACRTASYEEAWDVLVANGVAPIRGITVAELGSKANQRSRKNVFITALDWVAYFAPLVALQLPAGTSDLAKGLIAGVPQAAARGIEWASGYPDEFQITPSEGGYVTVYSLASARAIVPPPGTRPEAASGEAAPPPVPAAPVAPVVTQPTAAQVMMHNDSRVFMNEAEAEELIALSMIGEYVAEAR